MFPNSYKTHQKMQAFLIELLREQATREAFLSTVGRRADVLWKEKNVVFEIQCSPISFFEVKQRIQDYRKEGLTVIWLLHDRLFNRKRLSDAERFLRSSQKCYFFYLDPNQKGVVYDQLEKWDGERRLEVGPPLRIDILKIPFKESKTIEEVARKNCDSICHVTEKLDWNLKQIFRQLRYKWERLKKLYCSLLFEILRRIASK
jgi:competence CoiA-like predicted nuclease